MLLLFKGSLLWWNCVVLVVTVQHLVKGQGFLSNEEVKMEEIIADENEVLHIPPISYTYIM